MIYWTKILQVYEKNSEDQESNFILFVVEPFENIVYLIIHLLFI